MNKYKILFCLENEELIVLEIKRLGLPEETDKSKVYSWLLFEKKTSAIEQLIFKAMHSDASNELRSFEQVELQFNKRSGSILIEGKRHSLVVNELAEYKVSKALGDAIDSVY